MEIRYRLILVIGYKSSDEGWGGSWRWDDKWGCREFGMEFLEYTPISIGVVKHEVDVRVIRCRCEDLNKSVDGLSDIRVKWHVASSPLLLDARRYTLRLGNGPSSQLYTRNRHQVGLDHVSLVDRHRRISLRIDPPSHIHTLLSLEQLANNPPS